MQVHIEARPEMMQKKDRTDTGRIRRLCALDQLMLDQFHCNPDDPVGQIGISS